MLIRVARFVKSYFSTFDYLSRWPNREVHMHLAECGLECGIISLVSRHLHIVLDISLFCTLSLSFWPFGTCSFD